MASSGATPGFIMTLSDDVTSRKKAEQALRDAEEFKSRLIACSQDCIKMLDLEGRLLWMNEGGMQALEICDLGPFVNSSWIQFWEGEDAKAAQAAVEAARKGDTLVASLGTSPRRLQSSPGGGTSWSAPFGTRKE